MIPRFEFRVAVLITTVLITVLMSPVALAQAGWTQRFPSISPLARSYHVMAEMGNNVVLFGGSTLFGSMNDTWIWDGANWTPITSFGLFGTGPRPPARIKAQMAYHPASGKVVLFGGEGESGKLFSDTWTLQLVTNTLLHKTYYEWVQVSTSQTPLGREEAAIFYDPSSAKIVLAGGLASDSLLQDTWSFDPGSSQRSPSWTLVTTGKPTPARYGARLAPCSIDSQHSPDRLLLFGGYNKPTSGGFTILSDTWNFMTSQFSSLDWSQATPSTHPTERFDYAMAFYPVSNQVILFGGLGFTCCLMGATSDTWLAQCGSWVQAGATNHPGALAGHAMAYSNAKFNVLLFGGNAYTSASVTVSDETWTWGRRVACLPSDGSQIPVGTEVRCQFDPANGVVFSGWGASGFALPANDKTSATFHTEAPGPASITANWTDADGFHSQTLDYTILKPHH